MFYFSERALNELGTFAYSRTVTTKWGLPRWLSLGRETTITSEAGPVERVDLAVKKSRRRRQVLRDLWDVTTPGSLVDATGHNLEVGVMPFLRFGDYGELEYVRGRARVFWAHASLPPRPTASLRDTRELVVIGSIDNVVNGSWSRGREDTIMIGHEYPSEPGVLAELVRSELDISGPEVEEHMSDIATYEVDGPGYAARFAWGETERPTAPWSETKVMRAAGSAGNRSPRRGSLRPLATSTTPAGSPMASVSSWLGRSWSKTSPEPEHIGVDGVPPQRQLCLDDARAHRCAAPLAQRTIVCRSDPSRTRPCSWVLLLQWVLVGDRLGDPIGDRA